MELEREKDVTIQSAATFCDWDAKSQATGEQEKYAINVIDTPGHVDLTVALERGLHVLDGAVLSQTIIVDRQDICKCGGITFLGYPSLTGWTVQVPIGVEDQLDGLVDLVRWKAIYNRGTKGVEVVESDEIPVSVLELATKKRTELIGELAEVNDEIAEFFFNDVLPSTVELAASIQRATVSEILTRHLGPMSTHEDTRI
ncbi:P-loop containing nucleoside triphosphate hydrolase protein [Lactifluus subvellereus]|nr:P-loop containing nucleoside triphosphate hydrolase protein [Lactifluus subvellereus]